MEAASWYYSWNIVSAKMGAGTMNRPGPADHAAPTAVNGGTASYPSAWPRAACARSVLDSRRVRRAPVSDGRRRHGPRDGVTTATRDGPESETRDGAIERAETGPRSAPRARRGPGAARGERDDFLE